MVFRDAVPLTAEREFATFQRDGSDREARQTNDTYGRLRQDLQYGCEARPFKGRNAPQTPLRLSGGTSTSAQRRAHRNRTRDAWPHDLFGASSAD